MPGSTPVYGLPYLELDDPPDIAGATQDLAEGVETQLQAAVARMGYVTSGDRTSTPGTVTTTEAIIQSLTFTAVAGLQYKVTAVQSVQSTSGGDSATVRLRWSSGSSVGTSGNLITSALAPCFTANLGFLTPLVGTFSPGVSGQVTVGVGIVRNTGTGTLSSFGNANQVNTVLIEAI